MCSQMSYWGVDSHCGWQQRGGGDAGKTGQRAEPNYDAVITEDSASPGGARELGWPSKLSQLRRGAGLVTSLVIGYRPPLTPPRKET